MDSPQQRAFLRQIEAARVAVLRWPSLKDSKS